MSQRPSLKLKFGSQPSTPAPLDTPSTSAPKITLKLNSKPKAVQSQPIGPPPPLKPKAARKPKKDKPARTSTPTSKKRDLTASTYSDDDNDNDLHDPSSHSPQVKRLKLKTRAPSTSAPIITIKGKHKPRGNPPVHPLGMGYDSEASDREIDPTIEEGFILRMEPGEDCDYLRQAVEEKRWGPKNEGGADVRMRFLQKDGRRATITIQGRLYAASLVDLPCIVEGMKSWDRRGWWKCVDVCQMLLVLGRIEKEEEAMLYPLPTREVDESTWQYAHGLTPPMRWARKRRFRKRISNRAIEIVEEEVERLCRLDDECENSRYEIQDTDRWTQDQSARNSEDNVASRGELDYGDQDAEGDEDDDNTNVNFDGNTATGDLDDGLEADLELAMMMDDDPSAPPNPAPPVQSSDPTAPPHEPFLPALTTLSGEPASTAPTPSAMDTPPAATLPTASSSDAESDEDEADADVSSIDEDVLERENESQRQREEIEDLEAAIRGQEADLAKLQNPILRQKLVRKIQSLRGDLELKTGAIGEGGE